MRRAGQVAGIASDSHYHRGGVNAAYWPRLILEVTQAHYHEITVPVEGAMVAHQQARR